jgi:hypothetical protein
MPVFAVIYSEILDTFTKPKDKIREEANFWALMFLALAAATALANYLQTAMFGMFLRIDAP